MRCEVSTHMTFSRNDNNPASWLNINDGWTDAECIPHIPTANWLIERYCPQPGKETIYSYDYQFRHKQICRALSERFFDREIALKLLAKKLECNPILLLNSRDPMILNLFNQPDTFAVIP